MLPNLTNQYISYSMAVFSANEIRTFFLSITFFLTILFQSLYHTTILFHIYAIEVLYLYEY